jgi:hypothetical protein
MDNLQKSFNGFVLQTKKTTGIAKMYKRVQLSNGSNVWINSQINIPIETFGSRTKFITWSKDNADYDKLLQVDSLIKSLVKAEVTDTKIFKDAITRLVNKDEIERLEMEKQKEEQLAKEKIEREKKDIVGFYKRFLEGIISGEILQKKGGKRYSDGTIRNYKTFGTILVGFCRKYKVGFDTINKSTNDKFIAYCRSLGMMEKTICKNVICFRRLCNYAEEIGINTNVSSCKAWSETDVKDSDKRAEIYLPADIVQSLYDMKLSGIKEIVRDVFFVGCVSCLRFSDYSRLDKSCFKTTSKGTDIIDMVQTKTRDRVVIPILNGNLIKVMEKYDYKLPTITEQVLNSNIKLICKQLSETIPSLADNEITLLTAHERRQEQTYMENNNGEYLFQRDSAGNVVRPRWQMVSSHTARRSGITNLYLTRKFNTFEMMSISGHQSVKVFKEYIKLSKYETADIIAEKANI